MARRKVIPTPMMEYERSAPKTPYLGWGKRAIRKLTTKATSPRLLKYRECIAGSLGGNTYTNLKEVQEAFREAAHTCAKKVAGEKSHGVPKGYVHKGEKE